MNLVELDGVVASRGPGTQNSKHTTRLAWDRRWYSRTMTNPGRGTRRPCPSCLLANHPSLRVSASSRNQANAQNELVGSSAACAGFSVPHVRLALRYKVID